MAEFFHKIVTLPLHKVFNRACTAESPALHISYLKNNKNMQKISTQVEALHRVVAMLVAAALIVVSVGFYSTADAANLAQVSDTLSDSDRSALSNHTVAILSFRIRFIFSKRA